MGQDLIERVQDTVSEKESEKIPLKIFDEGENVELIKPGIYRCEKSFFGRIYAASQFAGDILRTNKEAVSKPAENYKLKKTDKIIAPVGELLKYPLIYLSSVNSFLLGLMTLRYSKKHKGYI